MWIVITLIFIGLLLVLTEIIFVPGTTIVGILGMLFSGIGVGYAFQIYDKNTAFWILGLVLVLHIGGLIWTLRVKAWDRFTLKSTVEGRSFDNRLDGLSVLEEGKALSDLKPIGKARFGEKDFEVKSTTGHIAAGTPITITRLQDNQILVKPL
ncbi:hypothetical protein A3SI_18305 [Nitritalea halalkaliphila LW7]|uniref:NfeD-like C-terminal domain-containing protein n=1 Tax=Nitritalea halalkaliphila LW7 TaxID=1189621 RepID=I5BUE8_9BACT|nr:NfeD family protein [Nitritalea halalkaliphila]EIM73200.1 hypothetical protein A3SI_18305 [Nitritalea halalkaliphila LW7]